MARAGRPDSVEPYPGVDIHGKAAMYKLWRWNDGNGTAVIFNKDGVAVVAICNEKKARHEFDKYQRTIPTRPPG